MESDFLVKKARNFCKVFYFSLISLWMVLDRAANTTYLKRPSIYYGIKVGGVIDITL